VLQRSYQVVFVAARSAGISASLLPPVALRFHCCRSCSHLAFPVDQLIDVCKAQTLAVHDTCPTVNMTYAG
jgi:hypothetical protein